MAVPARKTSKAKKAKRRTLQIDNQRFERMCKLW